MRIFLVFCHLILGSQAQREKKDKNRKLQADAVPVFEEPTSLEDVVSLMSEVMGENLLIKRRVNRVIQENQGIVERVMALEKAVEELKLSQPTMPETTMAILTTSTTSTTTTTSTTSTTTPAAVLDISLMEENAAKVRKLEDGILMLSTELAKRNNDMEIVETGFEMQDAKLSSVHGEFQQFRDQAKSMLTLQRYAISQMEHKYSRLERRVSSTKKSSPPRTLSDTIGPVLQKVFGLARSDRRSPENIEEAEDFMPQREFTNTAKVMWQLPNSCDELKARGLTKSDSGRYLIRLEGQIDTVPVYCDFESGKTIFPFEESGLEPAVIDLEICGNKGSPCLPKNVSYAFSQEEMSSIQSTFGNCEQVLFIKCSSSSVSDRLSWIGSDGSNNNYFAGSGDISSGCSCALGENNSCSGGFLCNCDAVSEGEDEGTLNKKAALPLQSLQATEIASHNQLRIALGPLTCWGKPEWTNWSSWSNCDASCEGGRQIRTRSCDGECEGENVQAQECNTNLCSFWEEWSSWSNCIDEQTKEQKACGMKERFRECDGVDCHGDFYEREQCNCVMVLGGNGHKLNVSLIDYENDFEQQIDLGSRLRMPALTAHCIVPFKDRIFVIGGWNTMNMVFEIRGCDIIPVRVRLTKNYRVHSCAVLEERIWVCGSRDDPFSCESYDEEFNMKDEGYTLFPHSYSAMVHNHRGLTLLGGISQSSGRHDNVEHYQNGEWSKGPSLPEKISSHSAHDLDGDIFVLGGLNADLGVMGQSAQVYRLAKNAIKWTTMPPLLRPRSHHASVALANGGIFLVGDPYSVAPVQIYANNQTETLSVEHKARAFPAAIHLSRPMC